MLIGLAKAFTEVVTLHGLFILSIGTFVGILGGALPGISATMTVALLAALTYTMDPLWALIMLAAAQVGATYGGSISATVINIPGTPSAVVTAIEGYALTKKGEGELALGVNVFTCFMANNIGLIFLLATMPLFVKMAMMFGPWEYFWFSIFGLVIAANLSEGDSLKAYIAGILGLLIGLVGLDPIMGVPRFAFGNAYLIGGIPLIPAMVGLYGLTEVFSSLTDIKITNNFTQKASLVKAAKVWWQYRWLSVKTSVVGYIIGVAPGIGANVSCWVGYDMAKRSSKHPELFGHGAMEGLIGSESCNNANVPGSYAPLLALGIPGDAVTAVVLGILLLHGIQPGPTFLLTQPFWLYDLAVGIFISGFLFIFIGTYFGKVLVRLFVSTPGPAMAAIVATLCVIGAYAMNNIMADVYLMFAFGVLGMIMRSLKIPAAPMVLGLVLATDLIDVNFRRALMASKGSLLPFFTRPYSLGMLIIIVAMIYFQYFHPMIKSKWNKSK